MNLIRTALTYLGLIILVVLALTALDSMPVVLAYLLTTWPGRIILFTLVFALPLLGIGAAIESAIDTVRNAIANRYHRRYCPYWMSHLREPGPCPHHDHNTLICTIPWCGPR